MQGSESAVVFSQRLDAIRHPQALPVDGVDGAPVDRGRTRAQRLIDAVSETDSFDKRQTFWQNQAHFDALCAVARGRIGRGRAPRWIGVDLSSTGFHATSHEQL